MVNEMIEVNFIFLRDITNSLNHYKEINLQFYFCGTISLGRGRGSQISVPLGTIEFYALHGIFHSMHFSYPTKQITWSYYIRLDAFAIQV